MTSLLRPEPTHLFVHLLGEALRVGTTPRSSPRPARTSLLDRSLRNVHPRTPALATAVGLAAADVEAPARGSEAGHVAAAPAALEKTAAQQIGRSGSSVATVEAPRDGVARCRGGRDRLRFVLRDESRVGILDDDPLGRRPLAAILLVDVPDAVSAVLQQRATAFGLAFCASSYVGKTSGRWYENPFLSASASSRSSSSSCDVSKQ